MPHTKAKLIHSFKVFNRIKGLIEWKIWAVPVDEKNPDGIRYRLVHIPVGWKTPAVLYDNHHPKGHHKHLEGQEIRYAFSGMGNLIRNFLQDVEALK